MPIPPAATPEALLARVAAQDRAAYRALYDATAAKLFGVTLRICRDRALAEDALQEAFVSIWRTAGDFDPSRGSGAAWLAGVARHRALDALRRSGKLTARLDNDVDVETLIAETGAAAADHLDLRALWACLDRLAPAAREAVLLAYCMGWTREELARRFETPTGTIKTWLRRALGSLRGCLEEGR